VRLTPDDLFRFAAKHPRLPKGERDRKPLVWSATKQKWVKSRRMWLPPIYIKVGKYNDKGVTTKIVYDGADAKKHGSKAACGHIALDFDKKSGELVGIEII
jgi:hypothetical protein